MINCGTRVLRQSVTHYHCQRKAVSILKPSVGRNENYWMPAVAAGTTFVIISVLKLVKQNLKTGEMNREIEMVSKELAEAIQSDLERNSQGAMAPTLVRLAWHSAGTYSRYDKSGGSNGATMRFPPECEWKANAGLHAAREFLEPFKARHPTVSYSDIWTLAGAVAIQEMGGPQIPWRRGRRDEESSASVEKYHVTEDRLPVADSGCPADDLKNMKAVFGRIGGLTHKEMVALIGAHAVGRCHTEASGYWGPWTNAETTFSNEFFRLLLEEKWTIKKTHNGKKWTGPRQYENKDGTLMMLPADLSLVQDPELRSYVELFAQDEEEFFRTFAAAFGKLLENGVEMTSEKPGVLSEILGISQT